MSKNGSKNAWKYPCPSIAVQGIIKHRFNFLVFWWLKMRDSVLPTPENNLIDPIVLSCEWWQSCPFVKSHAYLDSLPKHGKANWPFFFFRTYYELVHLILMHHLPEPGLQSGCSADVHRCLNITIPNCSQLWLPNEMNELTFRTWDGVL